LPSNCDSLGMGGLLYWAPAASTMERVGNVYAPEQK